MVVFSAGLVCHVFREEMALALHHASVWSELSSVAVEVLGLPERGRPGEDLAAWDLGVVLCAGAGQWDPTSALGRVSRARLAHGRTRSGVRVRGCAWTGRRAPRAWRPSSPRACRRALVRES